MFLSFQFYIFVYTDLHHRKFRKFAFVVQLFGLLVQRQVVWLTSTSIRCGELSKNNSFVLSPLIAEFMFPGHSMFLKRKIK